MLYAVQRDTWVEAVIVGIDLTCELAGKSRLVVGSIHLHNYRAKRGSGGEVLDEFLQACALHGCDFFGADVNQGMQMLLERMPVGSVVIKAPEDSDCTCIGVFRQGAQTVLGDTPPVGNLYSLYLPDLFWAATDETSHYLLSTTFRPGGSGARVRDPETAAEKKKRNQAARNERLREAKKKPASAP